ncbi:MAG: orotidine-5'-phosphate decarboxylase [bacterium]|nr:orotidine-5'-phosphate decarboxylase [bacterium]MDZ4284676.1 orotidine-5'-phosphate decarboxylase [Patescibacteria group bacterium]
MNDRNFKQLLDAQWSRDNFVCVGLDSSDGPRMRAIVDSTHDLVCAYKPNSAFYEAEGATGMATLQGLIAYINLIAPEVPVILDAKRADIGNTNAGYVEMAFDYLQADAVTVHPYLGAEALEPFLARADKGIIVLCRTSNPGAGEFQDLRIPLSGSRLREVERYLNREIPEGSMPFYQYVAYSIASGWNTNGNCALVVGATYPDELREVRQIVGDMPILIPGVGFQQRDVPLETQVDQVVSAGKDSRGMGMIINSSRGIIFASSGADFAEAARAKTIELHDMINRYRTEEIGTQKIIPADKIVRIHGGPSVVLAENSRSCFECGTLMILDNVGYKCLNCGATV